MEYFLSRTCHDTMIFSFILLGFAIACTGVNLPTTPKLNRTTRHPLTMSKTATVPPIVSAADAFKVMPLDGLSPQLNRFTPRISAQERLYQRIISDEQLTRPDLTEAPINVTVRIIFIKLQDLVEKLEMMETTVRVQIGWRDFRLAWDRAEFSGIGEILLPSNSLWIPDLAIINSVSDVYSIVRDSRFEIKVQSDGQLWWHPTGVLRTFCKLQLAYFPFDRQRCSIIVESPTFDQRFLNVRLRPERLPVDLRMYVESETWNLVSTFGTSQQIRAGVSTYFSRVEFWLILERRRLYHSINFIVPSFILSAIQTIFFFVPGPHPQRIGATTVTLLSVMVFQSMVVAQLPKTSESVPLLSIYIDLVILVSATSVCASIFTAMCNFNNDRKLDVPLWLQKCFLAFRCPSKTLKISWRVVERRMSMSASKPVDERRNSVLKEFSSLYNENVQRLNSNRRASKVIDDRKGRRKSMLSEEFTVVTLPTPDEEAAKVCSLESPFEECKDNIVTWINVHDGINAILGVICALAVTFGPIIIFGIVPNIVEHEDFPKPIGENFTLISSSAVQMMKSMTPPAKSSPKPAF